MSSPKTDLAAAQLAGIWEELLDTAVGPDDDFFDLGGYSLLMVQVCAAARKQGLGVTPDDIVRHRTPRLIAGAGTAMPGDDLPGASTGDARDEDFHRAWSAGLPPIQTGRASNLVPLAPDGRGAPVFVIHMGTGNIRFMRGIVGSFRGQRPAYGLESTGVPCKERPPLSVVEIATRYLAQMRLIQPHGPYLLVGPCAGGRIAYEIARQLESAGEKVALLAMVNATAPGDLEADCGWGLRELYDFRIASLRNLFGTDSLRRDLDRVVSSMIDRAWLDAGARAADFYWYQAVYAANIFAQDHYEAQPYSGELLVFESPEIAQRDKPRWEQVTSVSESHVIDAAGTLAVLRSQSFTAQLGRKLSSAGG